MLTSQSIPTRTRPIKSLNTPLQEAKTPEIETVIQVKAAKDNEEIKEIESDGSAVSSLSTRASKVKENLNKIETIDAVLLKADGSCEQIKCNTSSKQINKILNGRPTIIGELEEIKVIILRSLTQSTTKLNQNILPPPYCNEKYYGNYLLFSVDSVGNPANLSLKQYNVYVDGKKDSIQKMVKNKCYNSAENKPIKVKYAYDSDSEIRLDAIIRSEFDKKIRMECESKNDFEVTDVEIEKNINKSIQEFVNNLVFENSANRMIDPDYDPEEDEDEDPDYEPNDDEEIDDDVVDDYVNEPEEEEWRIELNKVLKIIREKGKTDGRILAEKISNTYFDTNGIEPTLDELTEIFSKIKSKYIKSESEIEISDENETVNDILSLKMSKTARIKSKKGKSETYNVYFNKFDKVRKEKNLTAAIKSFKMRNNREPTKFEINRLKQFLFTENKTTSVQFRLEVVDSEDDEKKVEFDREKGSKTTTPSRLLVTPVKKKKNAAKFNVYFGDKSEANKTEKQAVTWFERFNNRKPSDIELNLIKQFVKSDADELKEYEFDIPISDDDSKDYINKKINYETDINSVVEKKTSTKYTLNFNNETERKNGSKKQAIKWFKRFNNREPTDNEKKSINHFIQNDVEDTIDID